METVPEQNDSTSGDAIEQSCSPGASTSTPVSASSPQVAPSRTYRYDYYQSGGRVVVTVFAKNVKQENLVIDFGQQIVRVALNVPAEEPCILQLKLFGKIVPAECSYRCLSAKIEIVLVKAENIQWKQLEYDSRQVPIPAPAAPSHPVSTYPSSQKKTPNWDKLVAEVKSEEKDEKLEGDAALNKLFQDIYQNADEDSRRAMNKSFVESKGTVLSTNWKEVGSSPVVASPPKGK